MKCTDNFVHIGRSWFAKKKSSFLGLDNPGFESQLGQARNFCVTPRPDRLWGPPCFYSMSIGMLYLLTYLLTPWCRVLLEKLTGLQLVKKFPAFHGTRRFITTLTSVRHLSLSWASSLHWVKWPGRETGPSPPSSAQVNECSYTTLSRHRQNTITFTLQASKTYRSVCNLCTASGRRPLTQARTPIAVPPVCWSRRDGFIAMVRVAYSCHPYATPVLVEL